MGLARNCMVEIGTKGGQAPREMPRVGGRVYFEAEYTGGCFIHKSKNLGKQEALIF